MGISLRNVKRTTRVESVAVLMEAEAALAMVTLFLNALVIGCHQICAKIYQLPGARVEKKIDKKFINLQVK